MTGDELATHGHRPDRDRATTARATARVNPPTMLPPVAPRTARPPDVDVDESRCCSVTPTHDPAICSARRRLAGYLLDSFVLSITFVVGWYVWCLLRYRGIRGPW